MWLNEAPRTARPLSCCCRPARRRRVRRDTFSASPHGRRVRGLDAAPGGRALARRGRGRGRGRISHPRADEQMDPAARAEVLVELGFAERRTTARLRPTTCAPVSSSSPTQRGAARSRSSWAARSGSRTGSGCPCRLRAGARRGRSAARSGPLRAAPGGAHDLGVVGPQTYPIAEATIGELDLDALHGGLGSEILLGTMAHYEYQLGLRRERAIELARRALAPGNLLASGAIAFYYAVMVLPQAGSARRSGFHPRPGGRAGPPARRHLQRRVHVDVARLLPDPSRRSSSGGRGPAGGDRSLRRARHARRLAVQHRRSWRMRCWSRGRRTRRRE